MKKIYWTAPILVLAFMFFVTPTTAFAQKSFKSGQGHNPYMEALKKVRESCILFNNRAGQSFKFEIDQACRARSSKAAAKKRTK